MPDPNPSSIRQRLTTLARLGAHDRWEAVRALADQPTEEDTAVLALLTHQDPSSYVRAEAVETLGRLGGPFARIAVRAALGDPSSTVRWGAADVLVKVRTASDAFRLMIALQDSRWEVRSSAQDAGAGGGEDYAPERMNCV